MRSSILASASGVERISSDGAMRPPPAWLVSGVLCGMAFPFLPYVHLEWLQWFWLVPLLRSLREARSFRAFYLDAWRCMGIVCLLAQWWIFPATLYGGMLAVGLGSLFMSVPFLVLYALRRLWNWRFAVATLPVVWTAWEWAWVQTEFGIGGQVVLSLAQARLWPLVQYVDVTGAYGVTGWLILFSVLFYFALERWEREGRPGWPPLLRRFAVVLAVMLVPPLLYAAWAVPGQAARAATAALDVLLVQPNTPAPALWNAETQAAMLHKTLAVARQEVYRSTAAHGSPDLIVLPEAAVAYDMQHPANAEARTLTALAVSYWNVPVLTGTLAVPEVAEAGRSRLMRAQQRTRAYYNAATLLTPDAAHQTLTTTSASPDYSAYTFKQRLVPFTERVPYTDWWPGLTSLAIEFGSASLWDPGGPPRPLSFTTAQGDTLPLGVLICYEQLFSEAAADRVRAGAEALFVLSNESWFENTSGPYLLGLSARLRAVETRRAIARSTNTGHTLYVDATGRTYGAIAPSTEGAARGTLPFYQRQTFYVRHPHLLPGACSVMLLVFLLGGTAQHVGKRRQTRRGSTALSA